jgi:hypothetical protein
MESRERTRALMPQFRSEMERVRLRLGDEEFLRRLNTRFTGKHHQIALNRSGWNNLMTSHVQIGKYYGFTRVRSRQIELIVADRLLMNVKRKDGKKYGE